MSPVLPRSVYRGVSALVFLVAGCSDGEGPSLPVPSLIIYSASTGHLNVLDLETSDTRELTTSSLTDEHPALSPDGTRVVFSRGSFGGATDGNLFLINLDGTGETALTTGNQGDTRPSWSPNGQEIVFERFQGGANRILIVRPDGTNLRPLFETETREYHAPSWSPTGQWIALMGSTPLGDFNIHLARPDGSEVRQLTTEAGTQVEPSFSPNGQQVAYSALDQISEHIKVIRTDGTDARVLTPGVNGFDPDWSPEGDRLVFVRSDFVLHTVKLDGSGPSPVLDGTVLGRTPTWVARP